MRITRYLRDFRGVGGSEVMEAIYFIKCIIDHACVNINMVKLKKKTKNLELAVL